MSHSTKNFKFGTVIRQTDLKEIFLKLSVENDFVFSAPSLFGTFFFIGAVRV